MSGAGDNAAHCRALVREADPDRHHATLLAPAAAQPALFSLYAFAVEIARVRDAVSAPMPGEIRLQWWRDAVEGLARGDVAGHPVASALLDTIERFHLPAQAFVDLVDARVFDLYDDPMPTLSDLEGYLGETSSALVRLASLILAGGRDAGGAEAAGHAGIAHGLTALLRAFPWHARRGQLYLPMDVLSRHGVTRDDIVLGRGGPGVVSALAELRGAARVHLERTRALRDTIAPEIAPAFLPLALVPGDLARLDLLGGEPLAIRPESAAWRRIARLWWAARRGF